jgi:hypothetical protein
MRVLDPANRRFLSARRDRLRRRARIAFACAPAGFLPAIIVAAFFHPVPTDGEVIAMGLATFFGILGIIPICLKIGLDASKERRRITQFLEDGIAAEPRRRVAQRAWPHAAAFLIALFHNPFADLRRSEKCFGVYALPWWIVATSLFILLESVSLFVWYRTLRVRRA